MPLLLALLLSSNATGHTLVRSQQGTMVTGPSSNVLASFPFSTPGCYPSGSAMGTKGQAITVSRTGTRTCNVGTASAPSLITCQANEACVEAAGPISEVARTNTLLRSATIDPATYTTIWAKYNINVAAPVMTYGTPDVVAPDGTQTATKVVLPATSTSGDISIFYQAFTATAGPWAHSIWMRTLTGTATVSVYQQQSGSYRGGANVTVTSGWQRFTVVSSPAMTAATANTAVGVDCRALPGTPFTPAQTVYVWQDQMEAGAYAGSDIPTSGTPAARSADAISVPWPAGALTSWCTRVTAQPESSRAWNAVTGYIWSAGTSEAANSARLSATTGGTLVLDVYDGAGTVKTATYTHAFAAGSSHVVTACSIAGTLGLYVDGAAVSPTISGAGTGQWSTVPATFYFGTLSSTGSEWGGYLSGVRICKATSGCL